MSKGTEINDNIQPKEYSLWQLIKSDSQRLGGAKESLLHLGFYTAFFYRTSHYFNKKKLFFISKFIQLFSQIITGAEISRKAIIGPYLCILHPVGVLIGPNIIIGKNATICECSSIVLMDQENPPVIGDFLWLGPGGRIMGNVTIGDQVRIGPNSVVLKNIPSQRTALGIPARALPKEFLKPGTFHN